MKTLKLLFVTACVFLLSCNKSNEVEVMPCCPTCSILFQPYDSVSYQEAQRLAQTFGYQLSSLLGDINVREVSVLPVKLLTNQQLNSTNTRYRAEKILKYQNDIAKDVIKDEHFDVIIGLTSKDISTSLHNIDDYGIQGLSYIGKNNCVVSTFRIKNKKDVWKLVAHEFCHGYFYTQMRHCPADDPTCIMRDGHGKPNWKKRTKICNKCLGRQ